MVHVDYSDWGEDEYVTHDGEIPFCGALLVWRPPLPHPHLLMPQINQRRDLVCPETWLRLPLHLTRLAPRFLPLLPFGTPGRRCAEGLPLRAEVKARGPAISGVSICAYFSSSALAAHLWRRRLCSAQTLSIN